MSSRSALAFFAIALFIASVNTVQADEVDEAFERSGLGDWFKETAKEAANKIIKEVLEYVNEEAKKINWDCAKEVYDTCKINPVAHPKKYYKCAKNYLVENKEHCYHDEE